MEKEFCKTISPDVAKTIWTQILSTTDCNVVFSWGVMGMSACVASKDGMYMPALRIRVNALIHKGDVVVGLDMGTDTYSVALYEDGNMLGEWHEDVYFDELGRTIDELVEKPSSMTDDEYDAAIKKEMFG